MRCGCLECQAYMVHSEGYGAACVCPDCGYRCNACLGTNTVLSREALFSAGEALAARIANAHIPEDE